MKNVKSVEFPFKVRKIPSAIWQIALIAVDTFGDIKSVIKNTTKHLKE